MNLGKIFLGIMASVAAGATLGVLFAPDKGSSTRHKISKKGNDYVNELGEKFNGMVESVSNKYGKIKDEVVHMAKNGEAKVDAAQAKLASLPNRETLPLN